MNPVIDHDPYRGGPVAASSAELRSRDRRSLVLPFVGEEPDPGALALACALAGWWHCGIDVVGVHPPAVLHPRRVEATRELRAARRASAATTRLPTASEPAARPFEYRAPSLLRAVRELARHRPRAVVLGPPARRPGGAGALARAVRGCPAATAIAAPGLAEPSAIRRLVIDASALAQDTTDLRSIVLPDGGLCSPGASGPPAVVLLGRGATGADRTLQHLHKVRPGVSEVLALAIGDLEIGPDDLIVRRGQRFGAHRALQLSREDRALLRGRGASLLLTRPPALVESIEVMRRPPRPARSSR